MAARVVDQPQVGFWMVRAVKNGPVVPARIFWCDWEPGVEDNKLDRWPVPFLAAEIAGRWVEVDRVWHVKGQPITEAEFRFQMADLEHAKRWRPNEAIAQPHKPVDLRTLPIPFAEDS